MIATNLNIKRKSNTRQGYFGLITLVILSSILSVGFLGFVTYDQIQLNRGIIGHLKRAADANTVELALSELKSALNAAKAQGLTEGYTSVLYTLPSEDVGYWYKNLKAAENELEKVGEQATQLERSNLLLKLRETLMDHSGQLGDQVTYPPGLARFPNNKPIAFGGSFLLIMTLVAWGFMLNRSETRLIEVMIVIVIIGILAFSVVGQMS